MKGLEPNKLPSLGYAGEPSGPGYELWREEFCRRVMACDIEPAGVGPFCYRVTPVVLRQVTLSAGTGSAIRFTTLATGGELALLLPEKAPLSLSMGRQQLDLTPGQIGLNDGGLPNAAVTQTAEGAFSALLFDREGLLSVCPQAEEFATRPLEFSAGNAALLSRYINLVMTLAPDLDAAGLHAAGQHLLDLAALMLGARRDFAEEAKNRGLAAARFEAVKADVLARLADPGLNLPELAGRQRASSRYVQTLFERSGTTFSEFVLEQRLLLARRLLRNPLHAGSKISEIAFLAGFQNVSYFHRVFRRRFGMTPADARAAQGDEPC